MSDIQENWPSQQTILLLNDLPDAGIKNKLEDFGYQFEVAASTEAIEKSLPEKKCSVAFVDVNQIEVDKLNVFVTHIKKLNPKTKIIGVYTSALGSKVKEILATDIDDMLQIPFDEEIAVNLTFQYAPIVIDPKKLSLDSLVIANVMELDSANPIPFDVFIALPANKKVIKYRAKGHPIDRSVIDKAKKLPKFHVYILKSDMNLYREHCADVLKKIYDEPALPQAERTAKVKKEISNLMRGYFSEEPPDEKDQRQMVNNIRGIVEGLEDESGSKKEMKKAVMHLAAEHMTNYSHSQNVATYCALFGQILGINEPESLIMGGALHDIGLSDLPSNLVGKEVNEMDDKELAQYKLHPGNARYAVMEKKMKLPENILKMILQHHEHSDGSGFPYEVKSEEIHPFAKICAFADRFDKLTSLRYGHKQMTPLEAVQRISGMDGEPADGIYDPEFHKPLVDYFINLETEIEVEEQLEEQETDVSSDTPKPKASGGNESYTMESADIDPNKSPRGLYKIGEEAGETEVATSASAIKEIDTDIETPITDEINIDFESSTASSASMSPDTETATLSETAPESANLGEPAPESTDLEETALKSADRGEPAEEKSVEDMLAEMAGGANLPATDIEDLDSAEAHAANINLDELETDLAVGKHQGEDDMSFEDSEIDLDVDLEKISSGDINIVAAGDSATKTDAVKISGPSGDDQESGNIEIDVGEINVGGPVDTSIPGSVAAEKQKAPTPKTAQAPKAKQFDVNSRNKKGQTLLMHASANGKTDMVVQLLELGAEINTKDFNGYTPLMFAARAGHARTVQFLLRYKSDTNMKDSRGRTPLIHAIEGGHRSIVKEIIVKGGKTDVKMKGTTPLMLAAFLGDPGVVAALLEGGADPRVKDVKGHTAVHYAMAKQNREAAALIVKCLQGK